MCCGGTVATMAREVPSAIPSRRASSPTQAMSGPKLLRWGTGVPVEPEVNTQAAARAEPLRHARDVGEELAGANRRPGAIGENSAGGRVRNQRQRGRDIYFVLWAVM